MIAVVHHLQGLVGIGTILLLAWALSEDRKAGPGWRWIGGALLLQIAIALVVTRVPFVWTLVGYANKAVAAIEAATLVGSSYMFGYTGGAPIPVRRQNIWHNSRRRLAECGPRLRVDVRRRACGVASADIRWSFV